MWLAQKSGQNICLCTNPKCQDDFSPYGRKLEENRMNSYLTHVYIDPTIRNSNAIIRVIALNIPPNINSRKYTIRKDYRT